MTDLQQTQTAYERLSESERVVFARAHYGFFQDVVDHLGEGGKSVSNATVSRTWYGTFKSPNPKIVAALDAVYQRYLRSEVVA